MSGLIDQIRPKLQDGFELEFFKGGKGKGMFRLLKNGQVYKEGGFKQVIINDDDNYNYRRKQMKRLEEIGAVEPQWVSNKPKEREPVVRHVPTKSDLQIALERAQQTLKDPKANPTSRGHARDYIKLARMYVKLAKQTKRLQQRPVPQSPTVASDEH